MSTNQTPDLSVIIPTKWKPWVAAIGSVLTFVVPTVVELAADFGAPWPGVIAAVLAVLTWLGVYQAPFAPKGTVPVIVPTDTGADIKVSVPPKATNSPPTVEVSLPRTYKNPWSQ